MAVSFHFGLIRLSAISVKSDPIEFLPIKNFSAFNDPINKFNLTVNSASVGWPAYDNIPERL